MSSMYLFVIQNNHHRIDEHAASSRLVTPEIRSAFRSVHSNESIEECGLFPVGQILKDVLTKVKS